MPAASPPKPQMQIMKIQQANRGRNTQHKMNQSMQIPQQKQNLNDAHDLNLNDSIDIGNPRPASVEPKKRVKRKKVTIIKKRRERDGSMSVTKQHVFGMTLQQAIMAVQGQESYNRRQRHSNATFDGTGSNGNYQFNITQVFSPTNFSINNMTQNNNQQVFVNKANEGTPGTFSNYASPKGQPFKTPNNGSFNNNPNKSAFQFEQDQFDTFTQKMPRKKNVIVMTKKRNNALLDTF